MAEIKALRAWRYNPELSENIEKLSSPLFDVVSVKEVQNLYTNPYNSIHLSVPVSKNPYLNAKNTLKKWKEKQVLVQDKKPGIYVYYQYFTDPVSGNQYCRKGFICNVRICDWDENIILRHENTIPESVKDRVKLLEHTMLNVSPTHGLYSDEEFLLEEYMEEAIRNPVYETVDYQGVKDVMAIIDQEEIINKFTECLKRKQIILADGHHRYESSLQYMKKMKAENENYSGNEAYNYHLMLFSNMESQGLKVFPTHRLINNLKNFKQNEFIEKLNKYFIIEKLENQEQINLLIKEKKWTFGLILKKALYLICLRPELFSEMDWELPEDVKELDLSVMHYFIIEKVLDIPLEEQRNSKNISFQVDFNKSYKDVISGDSQIALITRAISINEIKRVCLSGHLLPQKSTFFYPKIICGFLFGSIKEDEFN